jgi:hypothetical protein
MSDLTSDELFNLTFRYMTALIGYGDDANSVRGGLQGVAYRALIVFRDAMDAADCAKRGIYSKPNPVPNLPENRGALEHLDDAAAQISALPAALVNVRQILIAAQRKSIQAH